MASGKRYEDETFEDYKLRLWCEEKAYRLYRSHRMGDMSFNDCLNKVNGMMKKAENIIETQTEPISA